MASITLTDEVLQNLVRTMPCASLEKLGRLLDIPNRTKLRRAQLEDAVIAWLSVNRRTHYRQVVCTSRACDEKKIEELWLRNIDNEYEAMALTATNLYKSDLYERCDIGKRLSVVNAKDDVYYFRINGYVQVEIRPLRSVHFDPGFLATPAAGEAKDEKKQAESQKRSEEAKGKALKELAGVMEEVWIQALNWTVHTDFDGMYPDVKLVLDEHNDDFVIDFRARTPTALVVPSVHLHLAKGGQTRWQVEAVFARLTAELELLSSQSPAYFTLQKADITAKGEDKRLGTRVRAVAGYEMRVRGALLLTLGYSALVAKGSEASAWKPFWDVREAPADANSGQVKLIKDERSARLRFTIDKAQQPEMEVVLVTGGFSPLRGPAPQTGPAREETEEEEKKKTITGLLQSAIKLGMNWEDSPPIRQGEPYTLPNPPSLTLYRRPEFGMGSDDCPPGWTRDGYHGCCVYVLRAALDVVDPKHLAACLATECKSAAEEDKKQLNDYLQGLAEGDQALKKYVTGLKLRPQQLEWTLATAAQIKERWLKQMAAGFDELFDDAGLASKDEDCISEKNAGEVVPPLPAEHKGAPRGSWGVTTELLQRPPSAGISLLKQLGKGAYAVASALGNAFAHVLQLLWQAVVWLLKLTGYVVTAAGKLVLATATTAFSVATKGMQLAAWIMSDPRRARFVLVLVRRMRITLCKRVGLYLVENQYAIAKRMSPEGRAAIDHIRQLSVTQQWASDMAQDFREISSSELSAANLVDRVYSGSAGQAIVGRAGKVVKAATAGFLKSLPFVGGVIGAVSEVVLDEVGDSLNAAAKQTLEIQRMNTDLTQSLKLLTDIFDVNGCLKEAGFSTHINFEALVASLSASISSGTLAVVDTLRETAKQAAKRVTGGADIVVPSTLPASAAKASTSRQSYTAMRLRDLPSRRRLPKP